LSDARLSFALVQEIAHCSAHATTEWPKGRVAAQLFSTVHILRPSRYNTLSMHESCRAKALLFYIVHVIPECLSTFEKGSVQKPFRREVQTVRKKRQSFSKTRHNWHAAILAISLFATFAVGDGPTVAFSAKHPGQVANFFSSFKFLVDKQLRVKCKC
jgi:hypothetical protein